ncbi:unnamed protein product [Caenorhabditis nigoni]
MADENVRYVLAIGVLHSEIESGFLVFPGREFQEHDVTRVLISENECPENLIGKWMYVKAEKNDVCLKFYPVNMIDDQFPTRIVDGEAQVKASLHFKCVKGSRAIYSHPFFGCVEGWLSKDPSMNRLNFEPELWIQPYLNMGISWKIADEHYQDYFVPSNDNIPKWLTPSEPYWAEGVVTKKFDKMGDTIYYVCSPSNPENLICLHQKYCPPDVEMVGRNISVFVDTRHEVQEKVKILPTNRTSRMTDGEAELQICFQYKETEHNWPRMEFLDDPHGSIMIWRSKLPNYKENGWYLGWIRHAPYFKMEELWVLSSCHHIQGPFASKPLQESPLELEHNPKAAKLAIEEPSSSSQPPLDEQAAKATATEEKDSEDIARMKWILEMLVTKVDALLKHQEVVVEMQLANLEAFEDLVEIAAKHGSFDPRKK